MPILGGRSRDQSIRERVEAFLQDIMASSRDVRMVLLFRSDGLLVASQPANPGLEGAGAQASAILESVAKLGEMFDLGPVNYILVSGKNAAFVIVKGGNLNLAVIGEKGLNLGFFLTQAEQVLRQCEEELGG